MPIFFFGVCVWLLVCVCVCLFFWISVEIYIYVGVVFVFRLVFLFVHWGFVCIFFGFLFSPVFMTVIVAFCLAPADRSDSVIM